MATQKIKGIIYKIEDVKEVNDRTVTKLITQSPIYDQDGDFTGDYRYWPVDVFDQVKGHQALRSAYENQQKVQIFASITPFNYKKEDGHTAYGIGAKAKNIAIQGNSDEENKQFVNDDLPF